MPANKKKSLLVEITEADLLFAKKQDRYACAIVRAIQRAMPEALRVRADTKEIAFSLPDDGTRYYFQTPAEVVNNVIKPFDMGQQPIGQTFVLDRAYAVEPIQHSTAKQRQAIRDHRRTTPPRAPRTRTSSGNVRTANRFRDYEAEEAQAS